jgi:hypothetical protein
MKLATTLVMKLAVKLVVKLAMVSFPAIIVFGKRSRSVFVRLSATCRSSA